MLDLESADKQSLLEEMVSAIVSCQCLDNKAQTDLKAHLLERESIGSTALGNKIAVPHGYFEGVTKTLIAFARLKIPIEYQAPDGEPVDKIFLIAGPKRNNTEHLMILARLSHLLKDVQFLDKLDTLATGKELLDAVDEAERRH